jgi:hypothetical protein
MNTGTAGGQDRGQGRGRGRVAGIATALAVSLVLVVATSASADSTASAAATVAPIDSAATGNYLLTVANTGEQKITLFTFGGGDGVAVAPSTCTYNAPLSGETGCSGIEPGKTAQVCFTGESSRDVHVFFGEANPITVVPALVGTASACPVPGFNPPPKAAPGPMGGSGSGTEKAGSTVAGFSLGKLKYKPKKGVATLPVTVTGAGSLKLSGKGVKTSTTRAKAAGTFTFTIQAGGKTASKLASTGKATVKVSVTFTPAGGAPTSASKTVKLTKG